MPSTPPPHLTTCLRACACLADGKIHYMEDTHKANHHAAEEERICMEHVRQRRVAFIT
jgi:hypothetical protein